MSDRPPARPPLRSPLTAAHARNGAEIGFEGGVELVRTYGDPDKEVTVVSEAVGLADVSVRAKIDVRGDATRTVAPFPSDVIARIADDWAVLLSRPGVVDERVASMQAAAGASTMVTDVTHLYSGFAIAGPSLGDAVARLTSWDPATLPAGGATGTTVAGVRAIVVRRETASPILEVYPGMELARYAWEAILEVVVRLGGAPVGWDALSATGWR